MPFGGQKLYLDQWNCEWYHLHTCKKKITTRWEHTLFRRYWSHRRTPHYICWTFQSFLSARWRSRHILHLCWGIQMSEKRTIGGWKRGGKVNWRRDFGSQGSSIGRSLNNIRSTETTKEVIIIGRNGGSRTRCFQCLQTSFEGRWEENERGDRLRCQHRNYPLGVPKTSEVKCEDAPFNARG